MILLDTTTVLATNKNSHPERSSSRTLRTMQSKDLRLLLPLFVLLLTATNSWAQKTATPHFNGQTAYNLTAQLLQVAPKRFNGSPRHLKAEGFIKHPFAAQAAKGNLETHHLLASSAAGCQTM